MSKYKYRYELYSVSQGEYYKCRRTRLKNNSKEVSPLFSLREYSLNPKQASKYDNSHVSIEELLSQSEDIVIILVNTYASIKELREELDELLLIEELKK